MDEKEKIKTGLDLRKKELKSIRVWIWGLLVIGCVTAFFFLYRSLVLFPQWQIQKNEQSAIDSLKKICSFESSWRGNDADGNGYIDFWTADVAGFRFIEDCAGNWVCYMSAPLAKADAKPLQGIYSRNSLPPKPMPVFGYLFQTIFLDNSGNPYQKDYDGDGKCYTNPIRYGFCAFPARYGETGKQTFIINEEGWVYCKDIGGASVDIWPGKNPEENGWRKAD